MISLLVAAALAASPVVSLEHRGTLRDALKQLAQKGGINLVATGDLDVPAEVYLKDLPAEEALEAIAKAYGLQLEQQGKLWVIKPRAAAAAVAPAPPVPAVAPIPPAVPNVEAITKASETAREQAERLRDEAKAMREKADQLRDAQRAQADALREKADELREAKRDEAEAAREQVQAQVEEARARAEVVSMNGPVTVKANERVESAISYGGTVTVERNARVDGDVVSFGGDVVLEESSRVDGDAVSFGGKVHKAEGARVDGEVVSFGGNGLGSMMASKAIQVSRPTLERGESKGGSAVAGFFAQFAVLFGIGFLLMMFAPARMKMIEAELQHAPFKNGVAGVLAAICSLPLTLFLVVTLIGIPVAVAFWMLAGLCTLMGLVAVANSLGARVPVPRLRRTQAIALAVGLLAMLLVARVPVLGPLFMSAATFVSLGAIIRTRMGLRGQGMPVPSSGFIDSTPVA